MDVKELEELLEAGSESQKVDFKESCPWEVDKFAKDILAFSNLKGGGYIIIGMKDSSGHYQREGIRKEHLVNYDRDVMKDQISSYADPSVDFLVHKLVDRKGLNFVVIEVREFIEVPIICKKDSKETIRCVIYYRNIDRRPESAPISNSYDMRNLIELAAIKMMKHKRELGYSVDRADIEKYEIELEGL